MNAEQDHVSGHVTIILPQIKEQANCTDSDNDIKMVPGLIVPNGPHVMSHVEQKQSHVSGHVTIILQLMIEQANCTDSCNDIKMVPGLIGLPWG